MPQAQPPQTLYLKMGAKDGATFHTDWRCESIASVLRWTDVDEAGEECKLTESIVLEHFVPWMTRAKSWDVIRHSVRRFCRVCSLEPVAAGALQPLEGEDCVTMTISPWPASMAKPRTRYARKPDMALSERAGARIAALAEGLGYQLAETGYPNARVMVGRVPLGAVDFVHRNFWAYAPPEDIDLTTDVASAAWTFMARARAEPTEALGETLEETWRLCALAHS